jgi:trehalose 6-phosphate synthase
MDLIKEIQTKLDGYKFIIASNREPYMHVYDGKKVKCIKTVSGLTIALDPVMKKVKGTWIAWGSGSADKEVVDKNNCLKVPPNKPSYTLKRIWLSQKEQAGHYYGYSNQALWPLCHIAYEKPVFLKEQWKSYKKVNQLFAENVLDEIGNHKAFIWLQDYHLALAAQFIKEKRPDAIIAMFWHIPWPNHEVFRICPQKKEILEGLLSCDLLGFHIRYHCNNFLETVDYELEAKVSTEENSVVHEGHKTFVYNFSISVDFEEITKEAKSTQVIKKIKDFSKTIPVSHKILALGVDRIDYTKGILERLKSIDIFLERYPEYQKKFLFYQIAALSRVRIPAYKNLFNQINELAAKINRKYSSRNWYPIIINTEEVDYMTHMAFYRSADLCMVNSLHDGMNLVAKEFVAANVDCTGVLLLSQFTGSARELQKGAVLINPYDLDTTADKIKEAIQMPKKEKSERMQTLREILSENHIYKWADKFISHAMNL